MKQATVLWMIVPLLFLLPRCDWGLLPVGGDADQDAREDPVTDGDVDTRPDADADVRDDVPPGDPDGADPDLSDQDTDPPPATCGNGTVDTGEFCDPPSSCPVDCDDGGPCTVDSLLGSAEECTARCDHREVTECVGGDACCPVTCNSGSDGDCSASCDNGVVDPGETCDPRSSCPTDCNDGDPCTDDTLMGSAENCNAFCPHTALTTCTFDDGCCPAVCNSLNDNNCEPVCDNGVIEEGETCDPVSTCPSACDDGNPCSIDVLHGDASVCTSQCVVEGILVACADGDGCCPASCSNATDNDCPVTCGDGHKDPGEECDFTSDFCVGCYLTAPAGWTACTDDNGNKVFARVFDPPSNQTWAQARDYCVTAITDLGATDYSHIGLAWFTDAGICTCVGPLMNNGVYYIGLYQESTGSEPGGGWSWWASDGSSFGSVGAFVDRDPCIDGSFDNAGGSGSVRCGRYMSSGSIFYDTGCDTSDNWHPVCMVQF